MDALNWWKQKLDKALTPRPRKVRPPSPYATFYERMMAASIDMTLLFTLLNPSLQVISKQVYAQLTVEQAALLSRARTYQEIYTQSVETGFLNLWATNFILQIVMIGTVYVTCQVLFKTTPGKWLLGLKITRSDNQTAPSIWRLILRYFAYGVSCAPLMLGVIWMNFDKHSRTWHDWIAGTRVTTSRPNGWYWGKVKEGWRWLKTRLTQR